MTATLPARHGADPVQLPPPPTASSGGSTQEPTARPRWERPGLAALLVGTALLYLVDLSANGTANTYYAAAVQAGAQSWKAFLFGSLDAGNAITVDKPPASLWPMELAARIFGFSSWSMLVPEALMGVASVWLLHATVRRFAGPAAGLIAGAALALTPVAVLMFRYNQPDALMVLCLVAAAYAVTRALDGARTRWIVLAGVAMGVAFLTKSLQGMTVLPALAAVYAVAAPTGVVRRIRQLLLAGAALAVTGGWWFTLVSLWPASDRPYIGGSTDNSAWELAFGYNGLGRVTGGSGNGGSFSGTAGIFRLFNAEMGGQISWLLPAALVLGVATAVLARGRARTAVLLFGGWLVVTGLLLSFMSGTVHPYYTVELAPAIAALVGIGAVTMWHRRTVIASRIALAAAVLTTGAWSWVLLSRSATFLPALKYAVLIAAVLAAVAVLAAGRVRQAVVVVVAAGILAGGAGSAAYAAQTASTVHTGSMATAGPTATGSTGGFGGRPGAFGRGGTPPSGSTGSAPTGSAPTGTGSTTSGTAPTGAGGGGDVSTSSELTALLEKSGTTWSAAVTGAQAAAQLELATDTSVIGIGGFTGSDNAPSLAQFQAWVEAGRIHYYIAAGTGGQGGSAAATAIAAWVTAHYPATTVGSTTVYDLTTSTS